VSVATSNFGLRASHAMRVFADHRAVTKAAAAARTQLEREKRELRPEAYQKREDEWRAKYGDALFALRTDTPAAIQQLATDAQRVLRARAVAPLFVSPEKMAPLLQVVSMLSPTLLPIAAEYAADMRNTALASALRIAVQQVEDLAVHEAVTTALAPLQDDTEREVRETFAKVLDAADTLGREVDLAEYGEHHLDPLQLLERANGRATLLAALTQDKPIVVPPLPAMLRADDATEDDAE
jgi:hypothetical protein